MTYTSTTNETVTLHDGSKVSKDFYELIKNHVNARYDALILGKSTILMIILGANLVFEFTPAAAINVNKVFARMVDQAEIPYIEADTTSYSIPYYQLIPSTPDLQGLPF